ncbi:hypothetical protein INR49_032510 [Caranx melampygus]|nr:hypothetical protein INR49_032510 [Caranx melampygus]
METDEVTSGAGAVDFQLKSLVDAEGHYKAPDTRGSDPAVCEATHLGCRRLHVPPGDWLDREGGKFVKYQRGEDIRNNQ